MHITRFMITMSLFAVLLFTGCADKKTVEELSAAAKAMEAKVTETEVQLAAGREENPDAQNTAPPTPGGPAWDVHDGATFRRESLSRSGWTAPPEAITRWGSASDLGSMPNYRRSYYRRGQMSCHPSFHLPQPLHETTAIATSFAGVPPSG